MFDAFSEEKIKLIISIVIDFIVFKSSVKFLVFLVHIFIADYILWSQA